MSTSESNAPVDHWLATEAGQLALRTTAALSPLSAKAIQRLRREWGPERAQSIVEIASLRKASLTKIGAAHDSLATPLVTPRAIQQATDHLIADYKASQVPADARVADVCCGMGGDAIAFARRGPVLMIDYDPKMCRFAAFNVATWGGPKAVAWCTNADSLELPRDLWIHVDPDRRVGSRRTSNAYLSNPNAETVLRLTRDAEGAIVKLAPAAVLPQGWEHATRREWISSHGECRQQLVWFCQQDQATRRATTMSGPSGSFVFEVDESTLESTHCDVGGRPDSEWLFDLDPAVRAAGLSESFAATTSLQSIGSPAGFFSANSGAFQLASLAPYGKLVQCFQVQWAGKWRESLVAKALEHLGTSQLEIKVRGLDLNPDVVRKKLMKKKSRQAGNMNQRENPATRHALLLGVDGNRSAYAAICQRVEITRVGGSEAGMQH